MDKAVNDGEPECDPAQHCDHDKLIGRTFKPVGDDGNTEHNDVGEQAVDTARRGEVVHANVVRQEIRLPCRVARGKQCVNRVGDDDDGDKSGKPRFGVFDKLRQEGDADDVDKIVEQFSGGKDQLSLFEVFKDPR